MQYFFAIYSITNPTNFYFSFINFLPILIIQSLYNISVYYHFFIAKKKLDFKLIKRFVKKRWFGETSNTFCTNDMKRSIDSINFSTWRNFLNLDGKKLNLRFKLMLALWSISHMHAIVVTASGALTAIVKTSKCIRLVFYGLH